MYCPLFLPRSRHWDDRTSGTAPPVLLAGSCLVRSGQWETPARKWRWEQRSQMSPPCDFLTLAPEFWQQPCFSMNTALAGRPLLPHSVFQSLSFSFRSRGRNCFLVLQVPPHPSLSKYSRILPPESFHLNHLIQILFAARTLIDTGKNCVTKVPWHRDQNKEISQ